MTKKTLSKLDHFFQQEPIAKGIPTPVSKLKQVEEILNIEIDKAYILFQSLYGGCVIKSAEVVGLSGHNSQMLDDYDIIELTQEFREAYEGNHQDLVIATDYDGSFIRLTASGQVLRYTDDADDEVIAHSFEEYITMALSE